MNLRRETAVLFPSPCLGQTVAIPALGARAVVTCCAARALPPGWTPARGQWPTCNCTFPLASIDAVVVSHSHPDHWSDLEGLYVAMRYFLERRGLPIYAPEGLRDLMRGENRDGTLDWRVIGDGDSAQVGPAKWTWSQTDHPVETLASRVEVGGRALGYSADTGPAWQLSALGEGVQLALVEACLTLEAEGVMQHLSARQAGAMAADAGAERLVITHLAPPIDRAVAQREAAAAFGGPVDVAEVGETWAI